MGLGVSALATQNDCPYRRICEVFLKIRAVQSQIGPARTLVHASVISLGQQGSPHVRETPFHRKIAV